MKLTAEYYMQVTGVIPTPGQMIELNALLEGHYRSIQAVATLCNVLACEAKQCLALHEQIAAENPNTVGEREDESLAFPIPLAFIRAVAKLAE